MHESWIQLNGNSNASLLCFTKYFKSFALHFKLMLLILFPQTVAVVTVISCYMALA